MSETSTPSSQVGAQHGVPGDPETGINDTHGATLDPSPFAEVRWEAPSKLGKMLVRGAVITISLTPTALLIWVLAPDELKYELRKQARWLPYMARYATWWLRKQGW